MRYHPPLPGWPDRALKAKGRYVRLRASQVTNGGEYFKVGEVLRVTDISGAGMGLRGLQKCGECGTSRYHHLKMTHRGGIANDLELLPEEYKPPAEGATYAELVAVLREYQTRMTNQGMPNSAASLAQLLDRVP